MASRKAQQHAPPPAEAPLPTHLRFDDETHASSRDRAEAWRTALSVSMDIRYEPGDIDGLTGALDLFPFGAATVAVIQSTSQTAVRNKVMANRWAYDHVVVDLFTHGGFTGQIGSHEVSITPGDCVMLDLRGPMRIRLDDYRCISLIMPRSLFDMLAGGYLAVDGLVFPATSPEARLLAPLLEGAVAEAPGMTSHLAASLGTGLTGLVAACARASLPFSHGPRVKPSAPTLAQLRRHIDRHAANPDFDPDDLCTRFKLSRSSLYRMFEPVGGVAKTIRHSRADLALHKLRQGATDSLTDVAQASGFPDSRAMGRALQASFGVSAKDARKAARAAAGQERHVGAEIASLLDEAGD